MNWHLFFLEHRRASLFALFSAIFVCIALLVFVGGAAGGVGGSSRSAGASGPVNITFAAGAIAINGVQGGLNEKHLKALASYIKEDIAGEMRGR
jgi:hypothetical protein